MRGASQKNAHVPVAQLDRASASEAEGYRFESCRGYFSGSLAASVQLAETLSTLGATTPYL